MENTPRLKSKNFECPHCKVLSQQSWVNSEAALNRVSLSLHHIFLGYRSDIADYHQKAIEKFIESNYREIDAINNGLIPDNLSIAKCTSCKRFTLWVEGILIYPKQVFLSPPNSDLDEDIKSLYLEAASIFIDSPKGATALLRLALQKLLKQVGEKGENINDDIKKLVSKGLSTKIQQALDLLRVVGNNAVHPGQIDLDDSKDIALKLFQILNFISDELITKPKELEKLYGDIVPDDTKEQIKQRDKK